MYHFLKTVTKNKQIDCLYLPHCPLKSKIILNHITHMLSPLRCWVYILWEFSLCVYFTVTNSRKKRKIGGQSSKSWIITRMCISTDIDNQIQVPRTCVLLAKIIRLKTIFLRLERKTVKSLHHVWLCNSMDCSTTGFPVHHQLPEFVQTHVHWVGDAIQPSPPLLSPSPTALNQGLYSSCLSQHQGLFQGVRSSHQMAKVLELQHKHQSFQWIFKTDFL